MKPRYDWSANHGPRIIIPKEGVELSSGACMLPSLMDRPLEARDELIDRTVKSIENLSTDQGREITWEATIQVYRDIAAAISQADLERSEIAQAQQHRGLGRLVRKYITRESD